VSRTDRYCFLQVLTSIQETKGRTLEEIGSLFGDEHIASHWYGISEEEKAEIARNALQMTKSGRILEEQDGRGVVEKTVGPQMDHVESAPREDN
jgi:hypothetical protein